MSAHTREVPIEELHVGVPLDHDIIDPDGRVLLRQGHVLLQSVVDRWVARGFAKVLVAVELPVVPAVEPQPTLTRDYDASLLAEVEQVIARAKVALSDMIFEIAVKSEPKLSVLEAASEALSEAIEVDCDAVAAQATRQYGKLDSSINSALLSRSVTLSTMATTTAVNLGMTTSDCLTVALAGVLHDVSLYEETLAMFLSERPTADERWEVVMRHPQLSADLLGPCRDVSEQVRVVITQVHEQVDGSGFPRGIGGHVLSTHSRLLNLVDAYLTLTDPNLHQSFVPADALAYLVGQTARGAFDLDCMRALLKTLSVYSVGSRVLLDDATEATVLRSSRSDPLRPVIRTDGPQSRIVDLRHSNNFILAPSVEAELPNRRRLLRAELDSILWQPQSLWFRDTQE